MKELIRKLADWSGLTDEIKKNAEGVAVSKITGKIRSLANEFTSDGQSHQQTNDVAETTLNALADWLQVGKEDGKLLWQAVHRTTLQKRREFHERQEQQRQERAKAQDKPKNGNQYLN